MAEFVRGTNQNGITCDIADRAGALAGSGPILTIMTLTTVYRLNGAGEFRATMPHRDNIKNLLELKKSVLKFYIDSEHEFSGIYEDSDISVDANGQRILTLMGRCLLAELSEAPVGDIDLSSSSAGITDAPADIIASANTFNGTTWTLDTTDGYATTATAAYGQMADESALAALILVAEHIGEHFRVKPDGTRTLVWLRTDTNDSGIRAIHTDAKRVRRDEVSKVCYIESLRESRRGRDLINRIYPYGGGEGNSRLDLTAATLSMPANFTMSTTDNYIESDLAVTALGKSIGRRIQYREIRPVLSTDTDLESAANELAYAALADLERRDNADDVVAWDLDVLGLPLAASVGDTIHVDYQDHQYDVNLDLIMIEIHRSIDQTGRRSARVVVGTQDRLPKTEAEQIAGSIEQGKIYAAHPLAHSNSYANIFRVFVGEDQTNDKAEIRFPLSDDILTVQEVLLYFKLTPIVDFAATVTGTSNHAHALEITTVVDSPIGSDLFIDSSAGLNTVTGSSGTEQWGATALTDGSGGIGNVFGLYREDAGNTFVIGDLEYQVNSGGYADLDGATDLSDDWYLLDITSDLATAVNRPAQELNIIEIRRKSAGATGKTAMLECMMSVRTVTMGAGGGGGVGGGDGSQYLLISGARALTADWDAGNFKITAETLESDVATGTAPLIVASTTVVANLNADLLDGLHGASYASAAGLASHIAATAAHGATGAIVGTTNAQTLTNKTIAFASNTLTNVMSLTTAQSVTAGIKKTFQANATNAGLRLAGVTADPSTLVAGDIWYRSDASTLTYRGAAGARSLVDLSLTQTLTNKTLTAPVLSGTITGTYTIGGTPTFPASVVTLSGVQTLTNKTLTTPLIGTIYGGSGASNNLILNSTSHATKGNVLIQPDGGNVGIGAASPDGTLHVYTASAGTVTATSSGDDLVVENNSHAGISILSPSANVGSLYFGTPADNLSALVQWDHTNLHFRVGTAIAGGELRFDTANGVEVMRIDSSGKVGIGVTAPQGLLHGHNGTGGKLFVTKTAIGGTAQTIIPNGTGDVLKYILISFVASHSAGGVFANSVDRAPGAGTVLVYSTAGADLSITFNANGSVTIQRTAGTGTFDITMEMIWM